jgi:hypothetical protein
VAAIHLALLEIYVSGEGNAKKPDMQAAAKVRWRRPESNTRGNATCSQSEKTERRFTSTGAVGLGMMAGAKPLFSFRDGSQVTDPSGGGSHADVPLKAQIASISVLPFETFLVDPFPPVISAPDLATHKAASDRAPR